MKYIRELKHLNYSKTLCEEFIKNANLDYKALEKTKQWHNNVDATARLIGHFGSITEHLKDKVLILSLFPGKQINIHADGAGTKLDNTYNVSINIPVKNCTPKTKTIFWDFPDEREIKYIHHEKLGTRQIIDKDQLERKFEYVFDDTAVLFRNEYPHSVENESADLRLMLSWRFKPEYSWDQAQELCERHFLT
jgi:hypothetical protein